MVILRRWQSFVDLPTADAFDKLDEGVGPALRAVLRPAVAVQAHSLGMTIPAISAPLSDDDNIFGGPASRRVAGEIYTDGTNLFVVQVTSASDKRRNLGRRQSRNRSADGSLNQHLPFQVAISAITQTVEPTQADVFVEAIERAFQTVAKKNPFENDKFEELLREEGRSPPPQPAESQIKGARELADRTVRQLAISIRTAGGILTRDLQKTLAPETKDLSDQLRERLERCGLAASEFVVVCRKSQASIATIPSRDALASLSDIGLKCSCGRLIAEEDVQEALTVTELGRWLLDGSKWLTLLLLEELQSVGVAVGETLVEQQFGGDEIDCLAVISGELVLFELKDKDFNLGSAYPFGAKVGFIQPDHSVILTTQRVGNDAREHFQRAKVGRKAQQPWDIDSEGVADSSLRYIEGVDNLKAAVQELASSIYSRDAANIIDQALAHGTLGAGHILSCLGKDITELRKGVSNV